MRYILPSLLLAGALAACGGGGAATGPSGPDTDNGAALASLSITPATGAVEIGGTLQLTATPLDAAGNPIVGLPDPQWRSSNPAAATVSGNGTVTGTGPGVATITAALEANGAAREATAQITVSVGFAAVRLSHSDFTLAQGSSAQLTATAVDASGNPLPGTPAASWQSSAPSVATISGGVVTAASAGSSTITASITHQGVTRTAGVRVTVAGSVLPSAATVHGVHDGFSPASVTIGVGGTVTWVMDDEEHDITWDGQAPPGGDVDRLDDDEQATRTFPTAGTYTYHCDHHDSRVESGTVVVQAGGGGGGTPVFSSLTVSPSPASVAVGGTVQVTATPRDQFGNPMSGVAPATWQTSNAARATVSGSGLVSGVAAGTATITASVSHQGTTRTATVAVTVGSTTQPTVATVRTVDKSFSPRTVTIATNGTVTWQFDSTHNVTFSGTPPSGGNIGNTGGGSVSRQFPTAGTYNYQCTLHSGMSGSVVVQ